MGGASPLAGGRLREPPRCGADAWDAAAREGRALTFEDAIANALEQRESYMVRAQRRCRYAHLGPRRLAFSLLINECEGRTPTTPAPVEIRERYAVGWPASVA